MAALLDVPRAWINGTHAARSAAVPSPKAAIDSNGAGSDTLSLIATIIDAERQYCRFLQFELSVGPDLGPLILTLTGPEGTGQFLEALLDAV
jgi:hypothetical protein